MKRLFVLVLLAALSVLQAPAQAQAQARYYNQAELDALLAPVALYPDPLLTHVLVAATYPDDLRDAAAWSRANPHLAGDDAVRAAEPMRWHPSVKALVAFPELLARMDESPQWTADLGAAFLSHEPQVMDTVQGLRRRAQASGALQSNAQQQVLQQGPAVIVQPVQQIIYVPYYDPYVVYGPWWWHSYRPVFWRPWHPHPPVFISSSFFVGSIDWHRRHIVRVGPRPAHVARPITIHNPVHRAQNARPIVQGAQIPAPVQRRQEPRREHRAEAGPPVQIQNHVHSVQSARPIPQAARVPEREQRPERRFEQRNDQREHRQEHRQGHRNGRN